MNDLQPLARNSPSSSMLMTAPLPTAPHLLASTGHVEPSASFAHGVIQSPISMPPAKRPKLSLQTSTLCTSYGSSSTSSIRKADINTATTPTTLNTFTNTFDLSIRPSPISASGSPVANNLRNKSRSLSPFCWNRPYDLNLPYGVKPILKNSSLSNEYQQSSLSSSTSPRTHRKVFFPVPKKVSFKPVLEEEIITQTYNAQHADLSSSEDETDSIEVRSDSKTDEDAEGDSEEPFSISDSSDDAPFEETELSQKIQLRIQKVSSERRRADDDQPVSSKRCKRSKRRWEWTITPPEQRHLSK